MNTTISESRTYVAVCLKPNGGYCFRKFTLPPGASPNDSNTAAWQFTMAVGIVFDRVITLVGCITYEDYMDFEEINFKEN